MHKNRFLKYLGFCNDVILPGSDSEKLKSLLRIIII